MINFRYHVVSLTAVFLALAIGLVVGTAALNGPVVDSLSDNVNALRKDNQQLRETVNSLREEVNREEDFVTEAAPILLADKLAGRRLLVVCLPSGRDQAEGVLAALDIAGATITGRIDVQDKFVNPDNGVELLELATAAARPTIPTTGLPGNSDGVETSSALLASALVDRTEQPAVDPADLAAVLDAYGDAGYITVEQPVTGSAEAVVVVSGQPYVDRDAAKKDAAVVTLVVQFDRVSRVVVAGTGSSDGNLVSAVRDDPTISQTISTVDNGNTTAGQAVSALAMAEQFTLGQSGHYGLGAGATSLMPKRPE
ncbi:copper transporter [Solwaraspora sp. WMMB335]|uniref:copper transporter n=1 Tax=Solwaraspora sp. WMMB335 TaxID=3404118 RepID=UPI003B923C8A